MARIEWDLQKYDGEFRKAGMERLEKSANVIRDLAKENCKEGRITRIPGRKYFITRDGDRVASTAPLWMERTPGAMKKTVRTVRKREGVTFDTGQVNWDVRDDNVRVYAGNFKTWWALQMEYGNGMWKGGAKPFLRPALRQGEGAVRTIIENG